MALLIADKEGPLEEVESFTRKLAGAEANVCIGLTRLGHKAMYVTRLGKDPFGYYVKKFLENENVITKITFDDVYKTGIMLKSRANDGEDPMIAYCRKSSAASRIYIDDIRSLDFSQIGHVHVTGILPAISGSCLDATYMLLSVARKNNAYVTFDPNLRPSLWQSQDVMVKTLNDLLSKANLVMPGLEEGYILTGHRELDKIAQFYTNRGVKQVVIKLGEEGAYVYENDMGYIVPGFAVDEIVDTVGAGDGFAAGVISGIVENMSLKDAVMRGNAVGAIQIMHVSDNEGLPTKKQMEQFMYS